MFTESDNMEKLISLKKEGKIPSLKTLILFEPINKDIKEQAETLGMKVL